MRFVTCVKNVLKGPDIDDQRIMESAWSKSTTGHTQPRAVVWNAAFPWWLSPCKKIRDINWFFLVLLQTKQSFSLIGWETQQCHTQTKSESLRCYFPYLHAKKTQFFLQILMMKEPCNLTGQKPQLATPNQKR